MTARKIIELINSVLELIDEKSLRGKIKEYLITIQNNSGNLVLLRDIANTVIAHFNFLSERKVPEHLSKVLVNKKVKLFTEVDYVDKLEKLTAVTYTDATPFFNSLNTLLTSLQNNLNDNENALNSIKNAVLPFVEKDLADLQEDSNALLALIFNDSDSYANLKTLSLELGRWHKGLRLYQDLVGNETPGDYSIIEIQQGSIEIVLNFDFDVVSNLLDLFKVGLDLFSSYLIYKSTVGEIVKTYRGNEKLIESEKEREVLLLENIKIGLEQKIRDQIAASKKSNLEALEKKVEYVTELITRHIVKGNDLKLISAPEEHSETEGEKELEKQQVFSNNSKLYQALDQVTRQKLIETLNQPESERNDLQTPNSEPLSS